MTRAEAIERFQQMKKILSIPNSDAARTIEAIDMAIKALEQQPKRGKWKNVRENNVGDCSECECRGRVWMNYCWNCGARMESE